MVNQHMQMIVKSIKGNLKGAHNILLANISPFGNIIRWLGNRETWSVTASSSVPSMVIVYNLSRLSMLQG